MPLLQPLVNLHLVVDKALEVVDAYHKKINTFEQKILLRPDVKTVKERKCCRFRSKYYYYVA
jgi:hypothetical protein